MTTDRKTALPEATLADLKRRIDAAHAAMTAASSAGNKAEANRQHVLLCGLLEVQMGRTSSAEHLTMTPSPPATR